MVRYDHRYRYSPAEAKCHQTRCGDTAFIRAQVLIAGYKEGVRDESAFINTVGTEYEEAVDYRLRW
jgi:hypothetical protein